MAGTERASGFAALKSHLGTQVIAVVCFVIIPVVITWVAPLSTITFQKSGSETNVIIRRYVLILVPWRTELVNNVTRIRADIRSQFRYADTSENRRKDRVGTISHATGQVVITGTGTELAVQAAPELARSIAASFKEFAADKNADQVSIPVYASWVLSYVLGGVVSFLCALYLFGSLIAIFRSGFRSGR